ncbi:tetratricopeptide repeat protein [Streptomyces sp. NPDC051310]|uniref:tetratricopeptide repeat protein n=1 Tax=Streptomyces sp. NPDC051310 TaxID=3365649 RepID=UPI003790D4E2
MDGLARALPRVPGQDHHDWTALAARVTRSFAYRTRPPDMEVALTLHMTALVDLLDAAHRPGGGAAGARPIEERLLDYERRHWIAVEADLGLKKRRGIETVLAAAFLCGAAAEEEADALLERVPVLNGQTTDVRWAVRDWIGALYPPPGPSQVWGSLRPDRLAEYFLGSRLRTDPRLADRLLAGASGAQATRLLDLHTRAAGHPAHHGRLDAELTGLCTRHPELLGPAAVDVATRVERPEPLVPALYRIADDPRTDPAHLMALLERLPVSSHNLAPWALHLTRRLTGIHRARADRDGTCPPELALLLRKLCARLLGMGRRQEAYEVAEEAVRRLRPSARADAPALLPHLAASLHNLSIALGSVGRRADAMEPAYEAVARYRELVAGSTDGSATPVYRSEPAHALNAVAAAEGELGRPERALTAVRETGRIRRELVGSRSDATPAQRAELADGLSNLAIWQQECGEPGPALESSRESVRRYRALAEERPDAFRTGHARSLGTYANCLRANGRYAEALRAAREALDIRRRLADASAAFVVLLGSAGEALVTADRRREALPLVDEAVTLLDGPLEGTPVGQALLGALLPLLGVLRQGAGPGTADAALRRAVAVAEDLVRTEPAHPPVLQRALCVLGAYLVERRQPAEGRALLDRATDLGRALAAADAAQRPALAWALASAGHYPAADEPRRPGALETTAEAVALGRRLAEEAPDGPAAHEPLLAWALADHGLRLAEAARYDEALPTGSEAVALARGAGQKPYLAFAFYARATIRLLARVEHGPAQEDIAQALALDLAREEPGLVATYLTSAELTRRRLAREPHHP